MKLFVFVMLFAIVVSLGSGLYFLSKDDQGSPRVLKALQIRVALSAILIVSLVVAWFAGWLAPQPGGG